MNRRDIIIVGAGISGLSLAHYCAKSGLDALVIEKNERTGGTFYSHRFEGDASGFWIELGAHTCYNSYRSLLELMEECDILGRIVPREKVGFKLLVDNRIKSIPSELNFPELLLSAPRMLTLKKQGRSIASYYSKIVGRRNFERVFGPVFSAVISQRADDFPAEILFKKRPRRKDVLKSFTLPEGIQSITDSIVARSKIEVMTGREVGGIAFSGDSFSVKTAEGDSYESRSLALATTASSASLLLRGSFPDLAALLSQIKVAASEAVGVAVRKDSVSLPPLAGIIPINDSFFSVVSRDTVPHGKYRGFTFHFKPGLPDREMKLKRVSEVLGVNRRAIEQVVTAENVVPFLKVGHEGLVGEIDRLLAAKRLLLTGNYFMGVAIEDCVARSHSEFSRLRSLLG